MLKNRIEGAVDAVLALMKAKDDTSLVDLPKKIDLQFTLKKIPNTKHKNITVELPTSIHYDLREVCLFVKDLNKKDREYEATVQHYEDFFKQQKIDSINKIVPIKALRTDYSLPSSKVQLAKAYDLYLADSSVMGLLPGILGKIFYAKKKTVPVKVDLNAKNLKAAVDKAVNNTRCTLQGTGSSCLVTVAHDKMKKEEIVGNVLAASNYLMKQIPGGQNNIRNMYIKSADTAAVPIYIDFVSGNNVKVPNVRGEKVANFVDEVTTVIGGKVSIRGDGQVTIIKDEKKQKLKVGEENPENLKSKPESSDDYDRSHESRKEERKGKKSAESEKEAVTEIKIEDSEELDEAEGENVDKSDDKTDSDDDDDKDKVMEKISKEVVKKSRKRQKKGECEETNDRAVVEKKKQKWTEVATERDTDKKSNKKSKKARKA